MRLSGRKMRGDIRAEIALQSNIKIGDARSARTPHPRLTIEDVPLSTYLKIRHLLLSGI